MNIENAICANHYKYFDLLPSYLQQLSSNNVLETSFLYKYQETKFNRTNFNYHLKYPFKFLILVDKILGVALDRPQGHR